MGDGVGVCGCMGDGVRVCGYEGTYGGEGVDVRVCV